MVDYPLEHMCSYNATLAPAFEVIGPVPEGFRVNGHFTGGAVSGPKLRGKVCPGGGSTASCVWESARRFWSALK